MATASARHRCRTFRFHVVIFQTSDRSNRFFSYSTMARNYTDKDVYSALEDIQNGSTIAASARKYGIPRSTLSEKRSGRHPIEHRMGPDTVLSQDEENLLEKWIFHIADSGFPASKDQLLDSVQMLLNETKRQTVFTDNRPGRKWYDGFKRRHPLVAEKQCQNLNGARASVTEENLRGWHDEVRQSLSKLGHVDILDDPERIFNMDETGFHLTPTQGKVNLIYFHKFERVTFLIETVF